MLEGAFIKGRHRFALLPVQDRRQDLASGNCQSAVRECFKTNNVAKKKVTRKC